ncbi:MAG: Site-specific recombinase phage integrase family [uncultured bacterium]|nr:MAG: Site-specific recombinase phage integrase family [uncultured bacterium]
MSLPTLKRQLHHITREMTIYYSNGAGFSDLFNNPEHFMHELKKTKPKADALAYIYNVLLSDEPIKGAHGHHINNANNLHEANKIILLENRKKTVDMFKKGELAYTETALGACTSSAPCDKRLLRSFTACFSCPKAAIKSSKVDLLVSRQKQFLNRLDTSSIEYQTERKELEELLHLQKKINCS